MREMPNSFFSHLLERVYVRGVHNSGIPLEKIYRSYKLGMTLLTMETWMVLLQKSELEKSWYGTFIFLKKLETTQNAQEAGLHGGDTYLCCGFDFR